MPDRPRETPWEGKPSRRKAASVGRAVGPFLGCAMVVHAIPPLADREGYEVGDAKGHVLATGPDGQVAATEVAPGDTRTTGPPVTSAGTDRTCALVRTGCSDAGTYSLEPSGSWTAADTGLADEMACRHGNPTASAPGENYRDREAIGKSVKDAVTAKKAEGGHTGRPPYGYQKAGENYIADPDTSVVLKQIFALAKDGSRPAEIRRYLNESGIPTPSGGVSWSIAQIQNILKNAVCCGGDNTEVLVDKADYDQIQTMTTRNKASAEDKEPDLFPMAVCGICGKKLTFKRSRGIYLCDRHTGEYPTEERLEETPKISVEELRRTVVKQYNEQLIQMHYFKEDAGPLPDLKMEERGGKRIELGERLLGINPGTPEYLSKVRNACEGYEGLWNDWIESLRQLRDAYHKGLVRESLPQLWRPMHEYNPQIGIRHRVDQIGKRRESRDAFQGSGCTLLVHDLSGKFPRSEVMVLRRESRMGRKPYHLSHQAEYIEVAEVKER